MAETLQLKTNADGIRLERVPVFFIIIILVTGTFLRISLLAVYPFVVLLAFISLRLRFTRRILDLLILIALSWLLSLSQGLFLKYNLVSLYYMIPFLLLLFATPGKTVPGSRDMVPVFFYGLSIIGVINDITGFIQVPLRPVSDDSFTGIYSEFSLSINGLSIVNAVLFGYYCFSFLAYRRRKHLLAALFFLLSSIMGFYGAGLMILIAAFILTFFNAKLSNIIKTVFISLLALATVYYALSVMKPRVLRYNVTNFKRMYNFTADNGARKVRAFYNYYKVYPHNIKDFLFGSGPGTFNSRSAFMVGSPFYFNVVRSIKSPEQPYYFKNYAYPLWNDTNTSMALFQDGFRNQPFSSLLAFLGEYGFLFTFFFVLYLVQYYRKVITPRPPPNTGPRYYLYIRLFKFLLVMLLLLMIADNYFEYAEITLLITIVLKLLQAEIIKIHAGEPEPSIAGR